jgi:hypothetical protein
MIFKILFTIFEITTVRDVIAIRTFSDISSVYTF